MGQYEVEWQVTRDDLEPKRLDLFWWFVHERQSIWWRRHVLRRPPPWTADQVLSTQRFTNVYRELDPGTRYVVEHVLEADGPKPDKVFNVMLYRLIGRAETHAAIGFQRVAAFHPEEFIRRVAQIRDVEGRPPFTAAYMVSGYASMGGGDKVRNVAEVLTRLSRNFGRPDGVWGRLSTASDASGAFEALRSAEGFGDFLSYQVLVDLLYPLSAYDNSPLLPYSPDDWAKAGPGARRGIAMLLQPGVHATDLSLMRWLHAHQRTEFERLDLDFPYLFEADGSKREISLANIQNCLCEYHKYVKITNGTGRGRRRFRPAESGETSRPEIGTSGRTGP